MSSMTMAVIPLGDKEIFAVPLLMEIFEVSRRLSRQTDAR